MDFILNEESLKGQFADIESFLRSLSANTRCFELIHKNGKNAIYKILDFYKCQVTPDERISDLKKYQYSDELLRFQIQLDQEIQTVPYWDENPMHDMARGYLWKGQDVTATAIAEAAERKAPLLSFAHDLFADRELEVVMSDIVQKVYSVYSPGYLAETCSGPIGLSRLDQLKIRYRDTRIDCTFLEEKYGPDMLEDSEYLMLVLSLDKFISHTSWEDIDRDDGLKYKKYRPSDKEDWFRGSIFQQQTIMKFRFSDVLRAYGYRHKDRFRLLRFERDHKRSNKG